MKERIVEQHLKLSSRGAASNNFYDCLKQSHQLNTSIDQVSRSVKVGGLLYSSLSHRSHFLCSQPDNNTMMPFEGTLSGGVMLPEAIMTVVSSPWLLIQSEQIDICLPSDVAGGQFQQPGLLNMSVR